MMHEHPCTDVRERLEAFYDGELAVDERIAIQNHLGECVSCSLAAEELDVARRDRCASWPRKRPTARRTSRCASARACSNACASKSSSRCASQVVALFQDMHLVWAGLGATVSRR